MGFICFAFLPDIEIRCASCGSAPPLFLLSQGAQIFGGVREQKAYESCFAILNDVRRFMHYQRGWQGQASFFIPFYYFRRDEDASAKGEVLTGVLYVNPEKPTFVDLLNMDDAPLATQPESRVRPGKEVLDQVMEELR